MYWIPKYISDQFPHYTLMTKAQRKQRWLMLFDWRYSARFEERIEVPSVL